MRVRVTIEADIDDLPPFREEDPTLLGAGASNVCSLIHEKLYVSSLSKLLDHATEKIDDEVMYKAIAEKLSYDILLTKRLVGHMKVEYFKEETEQI